MCRGLYDSQWLFGEDELEEMWTEDEKAEKEREQKRKERAERKARKEERRKKREERKRRKTMKAQLAAQNGDAGNADEETKELQEIKEENEVENENETENDKKKKEKKQKNNKKKKPSQDQTPEQTLEQTPEQTEQKEEEEEGFFSNMFGFGHSHDNKDQKDAEDDNNEEEEEEEEDNHEEEEANAEFEEFKERVKEGIVYIKHGRSGVFTRGGKKRVIYCDDEFENLYWRLPIKKHKIDNMNIQLPSKDFDLNLLMYVVGGNEPDPLVDGATGSANLRKAVKEKDRAKCFSLVFPKRSIDLECRNEEYAARDLAGWKRILELVNKRNDAEFNEESHGDGFTAEV